MGKTKLIKIHATSYASLRVMVKAPKVVACRVDEYIS